MLLATQMEKYFYGKDENGKHLNFSIPYDDRER